MTLSQSSRRQPGDFLPHQRHQRVAGQRVRYGAGEGVAVHGQSTAGRHLVGIGATQDQAVAAAHFFVQQSYRVVLGVVGAERVRAHHLRQPVGLVRLGLADGAHLVQDNRHAGRGDLPSGFAAGETAADDMDGQGCCAHRVRLPSGNQTVQMGHSAVKGKAPSVPRPSKTACELRHFPITLPAPSRVQVRSLQDRRSLMVKRFPTRPSWRWSC